MDIIKKQNMINLKKNIKSDPSFMLVNERNKVKIYD